VKLLHKVRQRFAHVAIRLVQYIRIFWYALLSPNRIQGSPRLYQPLQTVGHGNIKFEDNVRIGVFPSPGFLDSYAYIEARNPGSSVHVGSGTWINNGFRCIAEHTSITIGKNCLLGANVEILDSDFHGLALHERGISKLEWSASVTLEDDVFIGSNVKILKGVKIGAGTIIANSALVANDIPSMVIAVGIPAKAIRSIA
jgi:maltose O-acetyltransferase